MRLPGKIKILRKYLFGYVNIFHLFELQGLRNMKKIIAMSMSLVLTAGFIHYVLAYLCNKM